METLLITILTMTFNFHSVEIKGDKILTTSNNKTFIACEFTFNAENPDIMESIAESEGECFDKAVISIY